MKTSRFFKKILLLFTFAIFISCSSNTSKKKIGFLIRTFQLDRCVKERDFFTEKANSLGLEVIIKNADNNDQLQIEQGEEILNEGIDVLVIFPVNGNTAGKIVREANKKGIPVIAYESLIVNCPLNYFITADNEKGGELMASYISNIKPQGNYVLIGGDKADKNAVLIKKGQHKILDPLVNKGNIKILYDVYADWSADEGYHETSQYLKLSHNVPDVIVSSNDGLATGVIKALDDYHLTGKVLVTGLDGELTAFQRIYQGKQTMTIFKSFKKQAYEAAEMAKDLADGKTPEKAKDLVNNGMLNVPSYLLTPVVVDKSNLEEIIIKGGVFKAEDIYGKNL